MLAMMFLGATTNAHVEIVGYCGGRSNTNIHHHDKIVKIVCLGIFVYAKVTCVDGAAAGSLSQGSFFHHTHVRAYGHATNHHLFNNIRSLYFSSFPPSIYKKGGGTQTY